MTTHSIRILLIGAAFAAACLGDAVFTFQTLPANGAIQGSPGDTIGWGYTIENQSSSDFLVLTNLDAGSFFNGTATGLFDFPILAPGASVTETFAADTQGLYELTWDAGAPVGFTNTGSFTVTADWYDGDPSSGGAPIDGLTGVQVSAPYSAEVVAGVAAIPEPELVAPFLAVLLGLMIWLGRIRVRWLTGLRNNRSDRPDWQAEAPAPRCRQRYCMLVGQALSPANRLFHRPARKGMYFGNFFTTGSYFFANNETAPLSPGNASIFVPAGKANGLRK